MTVGWLFQNIQNSIKRIQLCANRDNPEATVSGFSLSRSSWTRISFTFLSSVSGAVMQHDSSCRYWDWNIWTGRHAGISAFSSSCYFLALSFILIGELRNSPSVLEELLKSFARIFHLRGRSFPAYIHNLYHHILLASPSEPEIKRCLAFYRQLAICMLKPNSTQPFRKNCFPWFHVPSSTNPYPHQGCNTLCEQLGKQFYKLYILAVVS